MQLTHEKGNYWLKNLKRPYRRKGRQEMAQNGYGWIRNRETNNGLTKIARKQGHGLIILYYKIQSVCV